MKRIVFAMLVVLLGGISVSQAADLSVREKALIKVVIKQNLMMYLASERQSLPEIPEEKWASHPFVIALSNDKDKEERLIKEYKSLPAAAKLNHAQALAYLGNKIGIEVLEKAALLKGSEPAYMTNSGFETSKAALCLLYLGYDFPDSFRFSKIFNPLFPELDVFLEKDQDATATD